MSLSPSPNQLPPLLRLPLELREQIYSYLLPWAQKSCNPRGVVKSVWRRGNTSLLGTNRQVYTETTSIIYGSNLFEIDIGYGSIDFQFRRKLASGLIPRETPAFPEFFATRNIEKMRNLLINVNHVDSYTGTF